ISSSKSALAPLTPLSRGPFTHAQASPFAPLTQIHATPPLPHTQSFPPQTQNHHKRSHPFTRASTFHHPHAHHTHSHHSRSNEHVFLEEMANLPGGPRWIELEKKGRELRRAHK